MTSLAVAFCCVAAVAAPAVAGKTPVAAAPSFQEPDHLVPVNPYNGQWYDDYIRLLREHLELDSFFFARMLVRPSFDKEFVVQLHHGADEKVINVDETKKVLLTYRIANQNIWYSMPDKNDEHVQKKISVDTISVEFPKPLAKRLAALWERMLDRSHGSGMGGCDGTVYEFGIWCLYGEVWSPQERKSPVLFIELGTALIDYCKSKPSERPAMEKEIKQKADALEKYLDEHPMVIK